MAKAKKTAAKGAKATGTKPAASGSGLNKPEAKKALDAATKALKSLKKQVDKNFWLIGRKLNAIAELELFKAAGFATIGEYAESVLEISQATAYVYMRIAASFSEELAATFGPVKLDRGLGYIAATPEGETARDIPKLKIRVPGADGKIVEKPFAETSTRELAAAAAHEKAAKPAKKKTSPTITPEITRNVARANTALDRAVEKSNAAGADVTVRTRDGEVLIDVRGVPLGKLKKALAAVSKALG